MLPAELLSHAQRAAASGARERGAQKTQTEAAPGPDSFSQIQSCHSDTSCAVEHTRSGNVIIETTFLDGCHLSLKTFQMLESMCLQTNPEVIAPS